MSDVVLRFPAHFTSGKRSLPSSGIDMTQYEAGQAGSSALPESAVAKNFAENLTAITARPWLLASECSLMGEEDMP